MELRQLRHFVTLTEEMHFGRASARLFISQPALSASIQRLEEDFGVRLFDRDSKGVRITLAGEQMLGCAREMLLHADRTRNYSRALAAGRLGRIEVGFSTTVLLRGAAEVVTRCQASFPDVDIFMREITSYRQVELLRAGRLDAGFVILPSPPSGLEHIALFEDRFVACLPAKHRLAAAKAIDIAELQGERFAMLPRDFSPSIYDQLVGLCATAGFHPHTVVECSHMLSIVTLVSHGLGVGLVPESVGELGFGGVAFVPLDRVLPRRTGYFVWNPVREAPGLSALFQEVRRLAESAAAKPARRAPRRRQET